MSFARGRGGGGFDDTMTFLFIDILFRYIFCFGLFVSHAVSVNQIEFVHD